MKFLSLDWYLKVLCYDSDFVSHKSNIKRVIICQSLVLAKRNTPYSSKRREYTARRHATDTTVRLELVHFEYV